MNKSLNKVFKPLIIIGALTIAQLSQATIVELDMTISNEVKKIKVNLFDETTPITVSNFLKYVNDGRYSNTVIHRAIPEFIVQGGGFTFENEIPLTAIEIDNAIKNEPVWSNVKGTIAMAKGNQIDSANSQWYFNLVDNKHLDSDVGGYTVFGQVIEGIEAIESITTLSFCGNVPMPDYSQEQCSNGDLPGVENFVSINQVTIYDPDITSANILSPVKNILLDESKTPTTESGSSGGSFAWFCLLALGFIPFRNYNK